MPDTLKLSASSALPAGRLDGLRVFRLELAFEATPSNNVQVCLGRDIWRAVRQIPGKTAFAFQAGGERGCLRYIKGILNVRPMGDNWRYWWEAVKTG